VKKVLAAIAGAFLLFTSSLNLPAAHAAVPTPDVSFTASPGKISGTSWTNDGSYGGSGTLTAPTTLPTYSVPESAVVLNAAAGTNQYIRGYVGSTSGVTEVTFQINMKYLSTQANGSYGMVLGWWGSNYDVWTQGGTCMGFNTGTSEIYGFNPSSYLGSYHTYTFVMSTAQDNTSKQKIFVDGVQQSLSLCLGSAVTQNLKTWGNANSFTLGVYGSNGSFYSSMNIKGFKLWLSDIGATAIQESYNAQFTPTLHTIALTSGLSSAVYRTASTLRSTTDVDGKVTFLFNGKRIPGCINIQTVSKVANCTWKPSAVNYNYITAQLVAPGGSLTTSTFKIFVTTRSSLR
jgi:hypothetical protein